jgi:hypothetical protein
MKRYLRILGFGFLVWLVPFAVSFLIFPVKKSDRFLFESIMSVVVTVSAVVFAVLYFRKMRCGFLKEGAVAGVIWLAINLALDLCMFMEGPMKMPFIDYMKEIGLVYLVIPAVCIGFGWSLEMCIARTDSQ